MLAGPHRHQGWVPAAPALAAFASTLSATARCWHFSAPTRSSHRPFAALVLQAHPFLRPRPAGKLPHDFQPGNHASGAPLCGALPRVCRLVGAPPPASSCWLLTGCLFATCCPLLTPSAACWRLMARAAFQCRLPHVVDICSLTNTRTHLLAVQVSVPPGGLLQRRRLHLRLRCRLGALCCAAGGIAGGAGAPAARPAPGCQGKGGNGRR